MTHNICFILLAVDKENNNNPLKTWGLYLFVLAFPGECVNQLGSEVKSIPERSAGWFKTLDGDTVWCCVIYKKYFFIDMKFGINQSISQTITQLSCIQLETPSSRLWNFWWIKTYTTFNISLCGFVCYLKHHKYCCPPPELEDPNNSPRNAEEHHELPISLLTLTIPVISALINCPQGISIKFQISNFQANFSD